MYKFQKLFCLIILSLPMIVVAGEKSVYAFEWLDPDKEVYVLQNRKFSKKNKVYLNVGGGIVVSDAFLSGNNIQARGGYFFKEAFGVEMIYSSNSAEENDAAKGVRSKGTVPFWRKTSNYYGAMGMWSPFYAKINTFNKIFYFDLMFGLGFAKLTEENNKNEFANDTDKTKINESHNSLMWDIAVRLYMTKHWSARLDLTTLHYKAILAEDLTSSSNNESYYTHYDLSLSLSYTF